MHCRIIDSMDELAALEPEWQALRSRSATDNPFVSPDWLLPWWATYASEHDRLHVVVARSAPESSLVGVLPLYVQRASRPLPHRRLRLLGDEHIGSTRLGCLADRAAAEATHQALVDGLVSNGDGWDVLDLRCMDERDPFFPLLLERAAVRAQVRLEPSGYAPFADLPPTWDEYVASLGRDLRKQVRRDRKRLEGAGTVEIEWIDDPDAVPEAVADVVRLFEHNMRRRFGPGFEASDTYRRFLADVISRFFGRGQLRLLFLRLDGARIAFQLGFRVRETTYAYQTGFDEDWGHLGVGVIAATYSIERAIADKSTCLDWGPGTGPDKSRWGNGGEREVRYARVYASSLAGALIDHYDGAALWSRAVAKRALPDPVRERLRRLTRKRTLSKL